MAEAVAEATVEAVALTVATGPVAASASADPEAAEDATTVVRKATWLETAQRRRRAVPATVAIRLVTSPGTALSQSSRPNPSWGGVSASPAKVYRQHPLGLMRATRLLLSGKPSLTGCDPHRLSPACSVPRRCLAFVLCATTKKTNDNRRIVTPVAGEKTRGDAVC